MTEPATSPTPTAPAVDTAALYAQANRLNAKLASGTDANLIREGKALAAEMIAHVKGKLGEGFDGFVHRVHTSEEYSLNEARQVVKTEKELKSFYLRAATLLEAAAEAETRAQRRGR